MSRLWWAIVLGAAAAAVLDTAVHRQWLAAVVMALAAVGVLLAFLRFRHAGELAFPLTMLAWGVVRVLTYGVLDRDWLAVTVMGVLSLGLPLIALALRRSGGLSTLLDPADRRAGQ